MSGFRGNLNSRPDSWVAMASLPAIHPVSTWKYTMKDALAQGARYIVMEHIPYQPPTERKRGSVGVYRRNGSSVHVRIGGVAKGQRRKFGNVIFNGPIEATPIMGPGAAALAAELQGRYLVLMGFFNDGRRLAAARATRDAAVARHVLRQWRKQTYRPGGAGMLAAMSRFGDV